jgi:hypothetical protein
VGESEDPKTQALKVGVPGTVALERGAVGVMAESVRLDDQAPIAPEEVDLVRTDARIDPWRGKVVATAEAEEETLELAARELLLRSELFGTDQTQVQGSADSVAVHGLWNCAVKVAESAGRPCHCDGLVAGRNIGNEGPGSVNLDAGTLSAATVSRDAHVYRPRLRLEHSPKRRRTLMAHDGPVAKGEHGCHTPAFEGEAGMADGVNPSMNTVEPPGLRPFGNGCSAEPRRSELGRGDHAVLSGTRSWRLADLDWRLCQPLVD